MYSRIIGTGSYLPKQVVTNADLEKRVDTSDQWIRERTGITQRYIANNEETSVSLGVNAAKLAIESSGIKPTDIDLIIFATTTPDKTFPSNACLLQKELNIGECPAFDIQAVCTGFIYGLDIANRFIKTHGAQCALVIGSEVMSRIVDWEDRSTCVLFGDGAGAVILQNSDQPGIYSTNIQANGQYENLLYADTQIQMKGNEVFKVAVMTLGKIVEDTIATNGIEAKDIDWLIPHQANYRIISATAKKLNMPLDRVIITVGEHGNTSAASIPLALDVAIRDGRIQPGDMLLLEAFGGGFTWGTALLRL